MPESFGSLLVIGLVVLFLLALFLIIKVMVSRYQKIPPNKVAIIYGRGTSVTGAGQLQGCKVVSGGGVLVWPVFQDIAYMDTAVFNMPIHETDIPNRDNVKITVGGFAACKISTAPEDVQSAAMSFLGQSPQQIQETIKSLLIGHLRSIIGKLNIDEILRDRDAFNKMVVGETAPELKKMGIQVVSLVIQDVADQHGYIDALGKRAVAEAVRDAEIKVAQAKSQSAQQVSTAEREAAIVQAANAVAVAEAEKDRDVKRATFKAAADTEKAKADQALAIATAAQQQTLRVAEAARDAAHAEAQTKVQEKEAQRKQQELVATVIKPAEAQRQATVIRAEAEKQAAILQAEAGKEVAVREAEGKAEAAQTLGQGEAAQTLATLNAKAEGEAAVKRQSLMAEAEGEAAKKGKVLLAEAEGTAALAEAWAKMADAQKLFYVLDRLPQLTDKFGDAGAKIAQAVFGPIASGLGSIDSIQITDLGGTGRGVQQIGGLVPQVVFDALSQFAARGVDLRALLSRAGVNVDDLLRKTGWSDRLAHPAAVLDGQATGMADKGRKAE
jgi:flotillin